MSLAEAVAAVLGTKPVCTTPLSGGCVGEVYRVELPDGNRLVAKIDGSDTGRLHIEGYMLEYLAPHLPVPKVVHSSPELLLMECIPGGQEFTAAAEEHAAELLARLHGVHATSFGLERDTLIGGLHQPNPEMRDWLPFFAEQRLIYMAREAHAHGRLGVDTVARVEALAGELGRFLSPPVEPALLHGDVWSGNVLARGGRITAFLDPAIYFGHPEVELAFITMFSTFGERFFEAYDSMRAIEPGFTNERRHLYNLYPYLVHVRLFGGSYRGAVEATLARFGF